ncbi:MAG TPA: glycosyltransferase [Gemmatimonadaceae bacterium]|nr:glycosyltransferase [Gemmatimonadaceae bacterium]HRQ77452.1 glycosyltransferase [Gemmatimonadaceae bacterium]
MLGTRPIHAIHVIEPASFGGAESVVMALSEGAASHGLRISVAAIVQDAAAPLAFPRLREAGITVIEIRQGRRHYLSEVRALASLFRELRPDIVHTHVYHADLVGTLAARVVGIPSVATVHGWVGGDWRNRLYERVDLLVLRLAHCVLCVSEPAALRVRAAGLKEDRVRVVPNGWSGTQFVPRAVARERLGLTPDDVAVGWIGRLSEEKGPDLLLDAMLPWVSTGRRLVIVGDGAMRDALNSRIDAAGVEQHVTLAGAHPDAGRLMPAFDAVVLSSRTEGVPMVMLDAMAARVPIVAFAVGGIPSVLDPSAAWLVPAGDTVALRAAVSAATTGRDAALLKSEVAAKTLTSQFGLDRWLRDVYSVYEHVLQGLRAR